MSIDLKEIYCEQSNNKGSCLDGTLVTLVNVPDSELKDIIYQINDVYGPEFITDYLDKIKREGL